MSDEDDDYMSEKVLNGFTENLEIKIIRNRERDRLLRIAKRTDMARQKQLEQVSLPKKQEMIRKEIESQPLPDDNIGLRLLKKMGYNPEEEEKGEGKLGKPIKVESKNDTLGLGFAEEEKKKVKELFEEQVKKTHEQVKKIDSLVDDFRKRKRDVKLYGLCISDVRKCQKVCYEMDQRINIDKPVNDYFWPRSVMKVEEDDESFRLERLTEDEIFDCLENIVNYLREQYFYCIYCGCTFEDEDDLKSQCPGVTREKHY
uniref:G patch domain-containing protein 11 n=1 Tax=Strongyloides venezuelensis TaxID=75913 RepID=A0A0K0FA31_STRVS